MICWHWSALWWKVFYFICVWNSTVVVCLTFKIINVDKYHWLRPNVGFKRRSPKDKSICFTISSVDVISSLHWTSKPSCRIATIAILIHFTVCLITLFRLVLLQRSFLKVLKAEVQKIADTTCLPSDLFSVPKRSSIIIFIHF